MMAHDATGLQDAVELADGELEVRHVLEHHVADDEIEAVRREWQGSPGAYGRTMPSSTSACTASSYSIPP